MAAKVILAKDLVEGKLYETVDSGVVVKAKDLIDDENHEKYGFRKCQVVTHTTNPDKVGKIIPITPDKEFYPYVEKKKGKSKVADEEDDFAPAEETSKTSKAKGKKETAEKTKTKGKKTAPIEDDEADVKPKGKKNEKAPAKDKKEGKSKANVKGMLISYIDDKKSCNVTDLKKFFEGKAKTHGINSTFSTYLKLVEKRLANDGRKLLRKDDVLTITKKKK